MAYTDIDKPDEYFNTVLYTGDDASNRAITGVGFKPDLVWHKSRSNAFNHYLTDAVRGAGYILLSNLTDTEYNGTAAFISFDTDGFTLTQEGGFEINKSAVTYAMWNWKANGAGVSNTAGSITSTVSANTTSGFSIVSYTGTGSTGTVGHGLGATPSMIIIKERNNSTSWIVYHHKNTSAPATDYLLLNSTQATDDYADYFNDTAPTSSVFTIDTAGDINGSSDTYIAYCFAEVKGYSKFGSYTGNGSTDGTFVYTGFKPAFVMVKETGNVNSWRILDNKRSPINVMNEPLFANLNNVEGTTDHETDFVSNGFKIRSSDTSMNRSGGTFIYMAFASQPFTTSTSVPTTAR